MRGARRSTSRRTTPPARALDGPLVDKPATLRTDLPVVGEGAALYPEDFPNATGPAASGCRLAGARGGRRAGRAARPGAAVPAPPGRGRARPAEARLVTVRPATPDDVPAIAALEEANLGAGRLVVRPGRGGSAGGAAHDPLPGRRGGRRGRGPCRGQHRGRHRRAAADRRRRRPIAGTASRPPSSTQCSSRPRPKARTGSCSRSARTTRARSASTPPRLRRDRPPAALLPRRRHRRGHAARAQPLTGPDANVCAIEYPRPV